MKGIRITCFPIQSLDKELKQNTHETIANLILNSKLNVPIVGVNRDTGSTSWHNDAERDNHDIYPFCSIDYLMPSRYEKF